MLKENTDNPVATYPQVQVLEPAECAHWVARIDALRPHWSPRSGGRFHTLGTAAYLDAPDAASVAAYGAEFHEPDHYYQRVAQSNPLLHAHFEPLHARLAERLATRLDAPVRYARGQALPGFHIFPDSPDFALQANHVPHYDRQFSNLRWPGEPDFRRSLSYTLSLELPRAGGGLKLWALDYYAMRELPPAQAKAHIRACPSDRLDYRLGELVLHTGNELHQILPWRAEPGERRITLQGHGLWLDGCWQLYW